MTIYKIHGQPLKHVGIYLPQIVFSQGQIYVAASQTLLLTNTGSSLLIQNLGKVYIVAKNIYSNFMLILVGAIITILLFQRVQFLTLGINIETNFSLRTIRFFTIANLTLFKREENL